MRQLIARFGRDTRGATSIEYAMIAGGIMTAIVGAVSLLATKLNVELAKPLAGLS